VGILSTLFSPVNYSKARLWGVEFEIRQQLDVVHELLKDFTIGGNATYIQSYLNYLPSQLAFQGTIDFHDKTRPMAGQPDFLLNAYVIYDNKKSGTAVGLFYTLTGESLVAGEAQQFSPVGGIVPRIVDKPWANLDLSVEQRIGKNWRITARAKNLLNPLIEQDYVSKVSNTELLRTGYRRGVDLSLGATYSW